MSKLTGKVAVVTGASKGIGAAIAKALAAEGASVVVNYASSKSGADALVDAINRAGGRAIAVKGNVTNAAEAEEIINAAVKEFGRLDILVNNAGISEFVSIDQVTEHHFHRIFNVNVLGLLLTTQAAVRLKAANSPAKFAKPILVLMSVFRVERQELVIAKIP